MIQTNEKTIILYAGHGKDIPRSIGFKDILHTEEELQVEDKKYTAQELIDEIN